MFIKYLTGLFGKEIGKTLINGLLIAAISIWGYYRAYHSGYQSAKLEFEIIKNQVVQAQLLELDKQIKQANQANLTLTENLRYYQQLGDKTTDELQKILAKTSALRATCRFDTDSMHSLNTARQRATTSATGGITDRVSTAGKPSGQ
ncbi:hypothetical protein [Rodentibacter sp. Ppn85]|uniref:hypothetical protein n=1 Tax=Rodentibacter sp. Ppn85 TaxID=1908525 RepID=UPI0018E980A7|nr:hypothetical protein [Rodentibacter sp. Ppn85]